MGYPGIQRDTSSRPPSGVALRCAPAPWLFSGARPWVCCRTRWFPRGFRRIPSNHSNQTWLAGKSPINGRLNGKITDINWYNMCIYIYINGPCFIAMFDYRIVFWWLVNDVNQKLECTGIPWLSAIINSWHVWGFPHGHRGMTIGRMVEQELRFWFHLAGKCLKHGSIKIVGICMQSAKYNGGYMCSASNNF